jgi:hypothetical protein
MNGLDVIIRQNQEAQQRYGINPKTGRQLNDSGSVQVQGDWSVLIFNPEGRGVKGYVEARSIYGEGANFFTRDAAVEFSLKFKETRVVRFHSSQWDQILSGVHSDN